MLKVMTIFALVGIAATASADPARTLELMEKVADWQLAHLEPVASIKVMREETRSPRSWQQGAFYAGLTELAERSESARFRDAVVAHGRSNRWQLGDRRYHADDHVIGQSYLWAAAHGAGPEAIAPLRKRFEEVLADPPRGSLAAHTPEPCWDRWCWCDALFMAPPVWVGLAAATGDRRYAEYAHAEFTATRDYLYDRTEHLFYRDSRFFEQRDGKGRKLFWSRGNGWVFAGIARVLEQLPSSDPMRPMYEALFKEMAAKLKAVQKPDGYWAPSLLAGSEAAPPESSGTGFFIYGMAWGIAAGLLDRAEYEPTVRRGWQALERAVHSDGMLGSVQQVSDRPEQVARGDTQFYGVGAFLLAGAAVYDLDRDAAAFPVSIQVDASATRGELKPVWRFFGADEPNYATMKDGRKLLSHLGELQPKAVFFRAHNLMSSGDGTPALKWGSTNIYTEDATGKPIYDWRIVDRIFDTYLERGVRPFAQIGFMPEALSINPRPYQHQWRPGLPYTQIITGWAYPPKDYDKWRELVYQWVKHCVERYGRAEVERWYWEVWNEANGHYWKATPEEFYKLHDYAIDGVRRALPTARVGGPHVAGSGGAFMDGFLQHVVHGKNNATGQRGTPTDFVAFHAKGQPTFVDGHVRMGINAQLQAIDGGFRKVAAIAELKSKPIIIGESDPEGCAACQGPQLGYRNGTMYSSYTAASFARKHQLADRHGVNFEGAITWAFEFEDQLYFAGFRALASNGIDLPVLNVFRMFSKMSGQRLATRSSHETSLDTMLRDGVRAEPDVAAFASIEGRKLSVMVWHYHDDDVRGPDAAVSLELSGLGGASGSARLTHHRIGENHSNAYALWKRMGSPIAPNEDAYAKLLQASELATLDGPEQIRLNGGAGKIVFQLPRQGVSLLVVDWNGAD
jgi:xylan 1,4-beta-xylosidase